MITVRNRVSISTLLASVGLLAVGFAALRVSSRLWANVGISSALLLLVAAIALARYREGRRRAYWVGFALFGWAYFLIAFGPAPLNTWRDSLISTPILAILEEQLLEPAPKAPPGVGVVTSRRASTATFVELSPWSHWTSTDRSNPFGSDSFARIGHSLFTLAVAIGGGIFVRALRDRRDVSSPSP